MSAITARGKFFFNGSHKFAVKGVTYGPFAANGDGLPFPDKPTVARDFALIRELGGNCLRTFTVPPAWLLDLAAVHGLRVLTGVPWPWHLTFLDSRRMRADIRTAIAAGVRACRDHPALFGVLVGNEIPPDIVRWHGRRRIRTFLRDLVATAKDAAPTTLAAYANFPSTEHLELDFTDFLAFNVYLHDEAAFRRYLLRLHSLAGDRPLLLTEFGVDSIREGVDGQARILAWQIPAAFETGAAGTFVFAWTDDWFTGGSAIEDWAFGLVDRARRKKPAFAAVQQWYRRPLPPLPRPAPRVSVVVCAYNAERTMEPCLESLTRLRYPDYEVIVVNDGSRDRTGEITRRFPEVRLIEQPNRGLSVARNVGLRAATGAIVAYTDSDCVADPDWLSHLVLTLERSGSSAVGGPNLPPPEDSRVAACVAVSPGGPAHVLVGDDRAEHVPGCNMAFRRDALDAIGGFDPRFHAAGDDVDVCWRLQDAGCDIAFSPAAMVWHFRRNTVRAYLRQQRGYGKAEAVLAEKHPWRFNALGQARWAGRIYGDLAGWVLGRRRAIHWGVFGRGLFQTIYEQPAPFAAHLPLTLEWNVAAALLLPLAVFGGGAGWLAAVPLLLSWVVCGGVAVRARIEPRWTGLPARALVAVLVYLGPLARAWERQRWRLRSLLPGCGTAAAARAPATRIDGPSVAWREAAVDVAFWNEHGAEKDPLLGRLHALLRRARWLVVTDDGWQPWDLEVRALAACARITACTENHGGPRRLVRVRCAVRPARAAAAALAATAALALGMAALGAPALAAVAAASFCALAVAVAAGGVRLARGVLRASERAARDTVAPATAERATLAA